MLAKRLLPKLPGSFVSSLDAAKLQVLRLAGVGLAVLLLVGFVNIWVITLLATIVFAIAFCMLREIASLTDKKLPPGEPLLVFGDALCWLLFFACAGYNQIHADIGIGSLFIGLGAGVVSAGVVVTDALLRQKLADLSMDVTPPQWDFRGYRVDDFMYFMPVFAVLGQTQLFLIIAMLVAVAAAGMVVYRYYQIMAPHTQ